MPKYYPVAIDLSKRKVLVVGGGKVALRKVETLLEYEADVTVVSPEVEPELDDLASQGKIIVQRRGYESSDLEGIGLVIASTNSREVNTKVSEEAQARNIPVNVVDVPDLCDFIVPATIRRGDLLIGIWTGGKSPALSRRIREKLEEEFGEEYASYIALMGEMREIAKAKYTTQKEREAALKRVLDLDILDLLREGHAGEARERALSCI